MAQVERLTVLASCVSINLETACGQYLPSIAPEKTHASTVSSPERVTAMVRETLSRVPGIGPVSARAVVEHRRATPIRNLADLRRLGIVANRAAGFITIGGRRLADVRYAEQLGFWKRDDPAGVPNRTYDFSPGTFR